MAQLTANRLAEPLLLLVNRRGEGLLEALSLRNILRNAEDAADLGSLLGGDGAGDHPKPVLHAVHTRHRDLDIDFGPPRAAPRPPVPPPPRRPPLHRPPPASLQSTPRPPAPPLKP